MVYDMFLKGINLQEIIHKTGYSQWLVYKTIHDEGIFKERKPKYVKQKTYSDDQVRVLIDYISTHNDATLEDVQAYANSIGFPTLTTITLFKYLDGQILFRSCRYSPYNLSTVEIMKNLRNYALWHNENKNCRFLYIQDFVCSIYTVQKYGKKHLPKSNADLQDSSSTQIMVRACVSSDYGLIHWMKKRGSFTYSDYASFLEELVSKVYGYGCWFIFDLSRVESFSDEQKNMIIESGNNYRFIPPSTPSINPIEEVFQYWKSELCRLMSTDYSERMNQASNVRWSARKCERRKVLLDAIEQASHSITVDKVKEYENHSNMMLMQLMYDTTCKI